jgi:hypothetical protein
MKSMIQVSVVASVLAILASPTSFADTSVGVSVGTLGGGIELAHAFSDKVGFRVAAYGLNYNTTETHESVDYDATLKLESARLLLDWFPFASNFRLSAGAMYNGNNLTLDGRPAPGGTFTFNGNTYSSSDIASVNGKVDFTKAAPYVGLGYGRPVGKGFSFAGDLGVLFQGSPNSTLSATCGPATPAPTCAQIQSDVAAEQNKLNDDMSKYKFYPVVSIGLAYVF